MTKRFLPGTLNPLYEGDSPYDIDIETSQQEFGRIENSQLKINPKFTAKTKGREQILQRTGFVTADRDLAQKAKEEMRRFGGRN